MGPEHANIAGNVHGGVIMRLVDTAAGYAALRHCRTMAVTARIDAMHFLQPVHLGDLVTLKAQVNDVGRTSMEVGVRVEAENVLTGEVRHVSSAYLINIGRGGLNDEAAVIRALRERWIAGAAIDAFQQEPLPPDSPFWSLDNAIITPHASGESIHYYTRAAAIFEDNLRRWLAGQPLRNLVDRTRGY
jgi:uncharacterized protein (TIGR00369 family)